MIRKKTSRIGVSSLKEEYDVIKVVEDGETRVLPTTTTVVYDPALGRLFLGALSSPFTVICEKQK
ncbi:hypothetical protein PENSUB_11374 [Penicillium subrubescens]|uniref:Uncharacterized protein n=1 Tax=Penicillium subrubescens TaxID=1316194 RepID=A0A1Q5T402_9EURO|nr:hypothetical protein PENSUB_11374 [Penicillium subrubescens]